MKYIHKNSKNTWKIYKKNIFIGTYHDLEEVQKDRDILVKNNWNQELIEKIKLKFSSNIKG